jgi:hypothetical protein
MHKVPVPDDAPLAHQDDAQEVFVVTDADGEICGVYASPARAVAYIRDCVGAADEPAVTGPVGGPLQGWRVFVHDECRYYIHSTHYRL